MMPGFTMSWLFLHFDQIKAYYHYANVFNGQKESW